MMRRVIVLAFLALAIGSAATAQFHLRDWSDSPEAWFMTASERAESKGIRSDEEARRFVDRFRARRGKGFVEEVRRRATLADAHLREGTTHGSRTLRGRIVVLLGEPTRIERSGGVQFGVPDPSGLGDVYTNAGPVGTAASPTRFSPIVYSLVYSGTQVQKRFSRKELVLTIEVDPRSARERFRNRDHERLFSDIAAGIARGSIVATTDSRASLDSFQ